MKQIIALGGGGFSMEPDNLALDHYILQQVGNQRPRVCFMGQASAEDNGYIASFMRAFTSLGAYPDWLSVYHVNDPDFESTLLKQDVIYVGGGNTFSMLALWRAWGIDKILHKAYEAGIILAGISAGAICWFEQGSTDSFGMPPQTLDCLGFLPGSCCPHYDGETGRRPGFQAMVANGEILPGYALDDGAAAHFVKGKLHSVVTSRPHANGYHVGKTDGGFIETQLDKLYLGG